MQKRTALILALAVSAAAQTSPEAAPGIKESMKQNEEALQQYSYKRRTQFQIKDISRSRLELVRYVDGKKEEVRLDQPQQQSQQGHGGRGGLLRGMEMKHKKEELEDDLKHLTSLLHSYMSPETMRKALEKATISKAGEVSDATVKIVAAGVQQPSDSISFMWSKTNHRPEKIEILSRLDGNPVSATLQYAALPDGPFYVARTIVSAPKKDIRITIDNFEYSKDGDAK